MNTNTWIEIVAGACDARARSLVLFRVIDFGRSYAALSSDVQSGHSPWSWRRHSTRAGAMIETDAVKARTAARAYMSMYLRLPGSGTRQFPHVENSNGNFRPQTGLNE
jgi:hypothetical protein